LQLLGKREHTFEKPFQADEVLRIVKELLEEE
jgi:hypothetical protein